MGGEERERERKERERREGRKKREEREAKKGSGEAKEGGGCEERRREGKGEGEGKPIPTNLNAYLKRVTVEWSHNMWGRSPFFFGPLQTTASSLFCSRKPIDITASI